MNSGVWFFAVFLVIAFGILIGLKRYEKTLMRKWLAEASVDLPDPWTYEWIQPEAGPTTDRYAVGTIVVVHHAEKGWMTINLLEGGNVFVIQDEDGHVVLWDEYLYEAIENTEALLEMS